MSQDAKTIALQKICEIAPPCSEESEAVSASCKCGRFCDWRDKLRDAQRLARAALASEGIRA